MFGVPFGIFAPPLPEEMLRMGRLTKCAPEKAAADGKAEPAPLAFKIGDVVRLKSGGHMMTVAMVTCGSLVGVQWSDGRTIETEDFERDMLVLSNEAATRLRQATDIPF